MAEKLMHAVVCDGYKGGAAALKHVKVPVPAPKKGEVLLKLEATSLNPVDWKIQKGDLRPVMPRKFPYIPGTRLPGPVATPPFSLSCGHHAPFIWEINIAYLYFSFLALRLSGIRCEVLIDLIVGRGRRVRGAKRKGAAVGQVPKQESEEILIYERGEKQRLKSPKAQIESHLTNTTIKLGTDVAGEVVGVGPGVKNLKLGDKVVAMLTHATGGGLAEFATSQESLTVKRPLEVSAADGAGLHVAGLTAHQALTKSAGIKLDGSGQPKNILVTAASGGVGHYAVQLAKLGNAHVTATCGSRNIDLVKSLGADEVLDYKTTEGAALKSPSGRKYDAVVHCATGVPWSVFEPNLSENGKVIDITPSASSMLTFAMKKLTFSKKHLVPLLLIPRVKTLSIWLGC
ncbi:hypothetical protein GIB67_004771 [Kingdonia uniflora]|uniref:Enoyl reductase (ER) domain-containing protein n=1 Tax=Kingdonia uniflora TaxID=39325 RepID=A0A7J7LXL4_9MAGN|nr:hypothetical protein GIB67_004771 [Kingdonia uniflora]